MARATCLTAVLIAMMAGCATAPSTSDDRQALRDDANGALERMEAADPGLSAFLYSADGYAIFPSVGKGALVAGGAYGRGVVYERGDFIGYADITQATVGAQIGGQSFNELIAFSTPDSLQRFRRGELAFAANASAVALKAGAAASADYDHGVAVLVEPVGGLMVEAAIGGQTFAFQP